MIRLFSSKIASDYVGTGHLDSAALWRLDKEVAELAHETVQKWKEEGEKSIT